MRHSKLIILLLALSATIGCAAHVNEYILNVGDFSKLIINDNLSVVYTCSADSAGFVKFSTTPELADAIIARNKGGKLKLSISEELENQEGLPTVYVYSKFLTEVSNSGTHKVFVRNISRTASFKASLIGNGEIIVNGLDCMQVNASLTTGNGIITLSGTADKLKVNLIGTGKIVADQLKTEVAEIKAMGTGSVSCSAKKNISIICAGSTSIYYEPFNGLEIKKTGSGKLIRISDETPVDENAAQTEEKEEVTVTAVETTVTEEREEIIEESQPEQTPILIF